MKSTKLKLNKKTIANLNQFDLKQLRGGMDFSLRDCSYATCEKVTGKSYWCWTGTCDTGSRLCEKTDRCETYLTNCCTTKDASGKWTCTDKKIVLNNKLD